MGQEQEEPEEHGQAGPAQLRVLRDADRVVGGRIGAVALRQRVAVGIAVGDDEQVRPVLNPVVEAVDGQVAKAARHTPDGHDREPGQERNRRDQPERVIARVRARGRHTKRARQDRSGNDQDEPEAGLPAVLRLLRRDLRVERVGAGRPLEARKRVRREIEVAEHVCRVAQVARLHVVGDRVAREQRPEPVDDREDDREDAEQREDDQVRDHQDEAEEDREAGALEVVRDDDRGALGRRACFSGGRRRGRFPWRRRGGLFAGHVWATYRARPMPFCRAANATTSSIPATTRQGSASPAALAVAPAPTLPRTCPAAQATLIRPAARP